MLPRQLSEIYILSWNAATSAVGRSACQNDKRQFKRGCKNILWCENTQEILVWHIFIISSYYFISLKKFVELLEAIVQSTGLQHFWTRYESIPVAGWISSTRAMQDVSSEIWTLPDRLNEWMTSRTNVAYLCWLLPQKDLYFPTAVVSARLNPCLPFPWVAKDVSCII